MSVHINHYVMSFLKGHVSYTNATCNVRTLGSAQFGQIAHVHATARDKT